MSKPNLIQIGKRILNVAAIRFIELDGDKIANVHTTEGRILQFVEEECDALLAALGTGYLDNTAQKIRAGQNAFEEFKKALDSPN